MNLIFRHHFYGIAVDWAYNIFCNQIKTNIFEIKFEIHSHFYNGFLTLWIINMECSFEAMIICIVLWQTCRQYYYFMYVQNGEITPIPLYYYVLNFKMRQFQFKKQIDFDLDGNRLLFILRYHLICVIWYVLIYLHT